MFGIDWNDLQLYHYLAIGGGGLAVLALILYFVLPSGFKVPAGIIGTVAGLVAGTGLGVIGMTAYGYKMPKEATAGDGVAPGQGAPPPMVGKGGPGMGGPGMGGPGMGGPGMGGPGMAFGGGKGGKGKGGGFGPSPKNQLASLVGKLNQLTDKPLTIQFTDEQRSAIREQLKGVDEPDELTDEDAKKRMDAIVELIKDNRTTLEAVGFVWPGTGFQPQPTASNPFKIDVNRDRLQALQERLTPKK